MNKEQRKEAAKHLRHGDLVLLSTLSGTSKSIVSKYVNGHIENSQCAPYFKSLSEKRKQEIEQSMNNLGE